MQAIHAIKVFETTKPIDLRRAEGNFICVKADSSVDLPLANSVTLAPKKKIVAASRVDRKLARKVERKISKSSRDPLSVTPQKGSTKHTTRHPGGKLIQPGLPDFFALNITKPELDDGFARPSSH